MGQFFFEGLRRRRERINLGLAQRVCPDLGQAFETKVQSLQKDWIYVHYGEEAEMLAVMKTLSYYLQDIGWHFPANKRNSKESCCALKALQMKKKKKKRQC